ncbi:MULTISPECIES: LysR family transcriptional regulator [Pseudomonas]|uniref:LysR family transcriptional regulator n=1 Tax=Pseudomonas hunanensis TaxID=1247546 RepID=A0ABD6MUL5_9PSED|nr:MULTISPECIES: LysR family transcriptional regulator [Pseudomonas]MDH4846233.1 LysR family transcriptional regulator [Pseudomonas sp. BN605]MDH4858522.1 LysR family transcriptional regulator [Pseudomonas sp. BN505]NWL07998.1 LysR family transcriptional regulator [Pseudomonas hunanensis]NWL45122.1 LysR family transcriptional regulator [Pseudomonas hunanensis]
MNVNAVELRHLRYFVAVAQNGGLTSAAESLNITQPPLTRQIRQLEDLLETKLFVRQSRGMELTDAGKSLLEDARNILALTEQALERSRLAGQGKLGQLDVGVFGSVMLDIVPRIIQRFRQLHPEVEVVLHNLDRAGQIKALEERRLTVGFNRFFKEEPGLSWEVLLTENLHLAVHESHPFATRDDVNFSEIDGQQLIMYPRSPRPGFIDHLLSMFHDQNVHPKIAQEVDDVVTAVSLVSAGVGLSFVVDSSCNLHLPGVVYLPVKDQDRATFDLCMIRRSHDDSRLLEGFLTVAREYAASKRKH